ncbi:MAG: tetratricopeptide repeat protein [Rhodoferax sp.]|nr:tetratricopeptide repeat protein [Rhodoferax sp.]
MKLKLDLPTPLEWFAALVQHDEQLPLFEAALSLAQDEYPELDPQQVLGNLDQLVARLRRRLPADAPALQRLRTLNQFFFQEMGFSVNPNNYYDPDNSYLHEVLRTRRGIPISLALVWLELAQAVGLQAEGVSFPGHFLVKVGMPRGQVVIDPLSGQSLSREDLSERLDPYRHRMASGGTLDDPVGTYLQAARPREILARMLRNLKEIHRSQQDWARLVAVQDRLIVLLPRAWGEYRDRGLARAELGRSTLAVADLELYLSFAEDGPDIEDIAQRVLQLRRPPG